ncbi:hypothetical protein [Cupriavidus sp. TMH.W2]|uniref:hypothetical protein n=1 Tax=Cupriavidus sp. TMH.W2 TaxID=3434465 RepID=UPI003D787D77
MKKTVILLMVSGSLGVAACGSKTDPSEKNFGAALSQYFEKKGDLCLGLTEWPIDLSEADLRVQKSWPTGTAARMAALEQAGLVQGAMTEVERQSFFGNRTNKFTVKRYTLTDAAKPYYHEKDVSVMTLGGGAKTVKQGDLCYGKTTLDKVVKWEGPMKLGDYQEARVTYQYQINGLANWVKRPEIRTTFPQLAKMVDGAGKDALTHAVKLTSLGWEAKGLD